MDGEPEFSQREVGNRQASARTNSAVEWWNCELHSVIGKQQPDVYLQVVVFVSVVGPISTAAIRAYCTLTPPMEFRHSSPEALHIKQRERPLIAKDGTKARKFI
jgi:hypothetical protein